MVVIWNSARHIHGKPLSEAKMQLLIWGKHKNIEIIFFEMFTVFKELITFFKQIRMNTIRNANALKRIHRMLIN